MKALIVMSGIILILAAYIFGKKVGFKKGFIEGKADLMLELRERSLIDGCCFFCRTRNSADVYQNSEIGEASPNNRGIGTGLYGKIEE